MREWVGNDTLFSEEETYATAVARNMIEMVWNINENWDGHDAQTGVTCYTCHRGNAIPAERLVLARAPQQLGGPECEHVRTRPGGQLFNRPAR